MTTERRDGFEPETRIPVYILAGGRSRRFGSNKARALIDGVPLLVTVADTLAPVASSVTVVAASDDEYEDLGLRTIGDVVADRGPLGGLLTAIRDQADQGWLLLVACDWIGIRVEWTRQLLAARRDGTTVAVFHSDRDEPLLGVYHTRIEPVVTAGIEGQDWSMQSLLELVTVERVASPENWHEATNLNRLPGSGLC